MFAGTRSWDDYLIRLHGTVLPSDDMWSTPLFSERKWTEARNCVGKELSKTGNRKSTDRAKSKNRTPSWQAPRLPFLPTEDWPGNISSGRPVARTRGAGGANTAYRPENTCQELPSVTMPSENPLGSHLRKRPGPDPVAQKSRSCSPTSGAAKRS